MRKVKPAKGAYAVWEYGRYPYLLCGEIGDMPSGASGLGGHNSSVYVPSFQSWFVPKFCVAKDDGLALKAELQRLADKDKLSEQHRRRILDDIRKRSVLGQLDPRS
jgi:hypothetical protein